MAWLPGDEGSHGLVDVLAGDVDAGGRLPVSLLRSVGQVGAYAGHHHGGGRSLMYGDYVDGPVSPLFPFGHGLSFTTWSYDDVAVDAGSTLDDIVVDVTVTNTGDRDGEEVVQVFARDELASVGRPAKQLVAFKRVAAAAGESIHLRVHHFGESARIPRRGPALPGRTRRCHVSRRSDLDHRCDRRRSRPPRSELHPRDFK